MAMLLRRPCFALSRFAVPAQKRLNIAPLRREFKSDAGEVAAGDFVDVSGKVYEIVSVERVRHNSRGSALCQLDLKEVLTGKKHTERYRTDQKVEVVELDPVTITFKGPSETPGKYLFTDAEGEDLELDESWFGSAGPFFKEGQEMTLRRYDGRPIDWKIFDGLVEFTVVQTPEYRKGDQQNARPKNATLDTGVVIKVPTYVDNGDRIIVDLRKDPPGFERRVEE